MSGRGVEYPKFRIERRDYAPLLAQPRHRDPSPRISIAVAGAFTEETDRQSAKATIATVLVKSPEGAHATRFGADGARIVSIVFDERSFADHVGVVPGGWRLIGKSAGAALAARLLSAARSGDPNEIAVAVHDCGVAETVGDEIRKSPPAFLARLEDALAEQGLRAVNVAAVARSAGVHPAHLSRLFRRLRGESISDFSRRHAVRRAMNVLNERNAPLADVAARAGFSDQSHMTRAFRAVAGVTPLEWRKLATGERRAG